MPGKAAMDGCIRGAKCVAVSLRMQRAWSAAHCPLLQTMATHVQDDQEGLQNVTNFHRVRRHSVCST